MSAKSSAVLYALVAAAGACAVALAASTASVQAAQRNNGASIDSNCEVVSVGNSYCTIDGKGYYCTTGTSPDKGKDCVAAAKVKKPRVPTGAVNSSGALKAK